MSSGGYNPIRTQYDVLELQLCHPFRLATGVDDTTRRTVIVRIGEGIGEATPVYYMGETIETISAALAGFTVPDDLTLTSLEDVLRQFDFVVAHTPAAKTGIDLALHDLLSKRAGKSISELLGITPNPQVPTSYTIGIAEPDVIREKLEAAQPYPILKIKVGSPADWETLRLVRSLSDKPIRVDANQGWTAPQAIEMVKQLADFGVELVEQPVPRDDLDGLEAVTQASPLPIIADESCQKPTDVARLAGKVHGINIKLMKCGGISAALQMIESARRYEMKVMLGCMIETSVGITAAAHLAPLVDYADLDGNLLIRNDPFVGATIENGCLRLPTIPGLGISPKS